VTGVEQALANQTRQADRRRQTDGSTPINRQARLPWQPESSAAPTTSRRPSARPDADFLACACLH
jgi:hypothetical protein